MQPGLQNVVNLLQNFIQSCSCRIFLTAATLSMVTVGGKRLDPVFCQPSPGEGASPRVPYARRIRRVRAPPGRRCRSRACGLAVPGSKSSSHGDTVHTHRGVNHLWSTEGNEALREMEFAGRVASAADPAKAGCETRPAEVPGGRKYDALLHPRSRRLSDRRSDHGPGQTRCRSEQHRPVMKVLPYI